MNATRISIIVLVVVIGGILIYIFTRPQPAVENNTQSENTAPTSEVSENESMMDDDSDEDLVTIEVSGENFSYDPEEITVKAGQKVKIKFTANDMQHDFVIDELDVKSDVVTSGNTTEFEFTPTEAGEFEYYCSVGNHRAQGMVGTLTVTE